MKKPCTEHYDLVKINLFEGFVRDRAAYDTLVKNYGCTDERISPYNVLKMKTHKFERIFVFYQDTPNEK